FTRKICTFTHRVYCFARLNYDNFLEVSLLASFFLSDNNDYNQKRSIEFRVSITILMVLFSLVLLGYMLVRVQYKAAERNYLESRSDINY
uniref:hypothetical protein n=1 Tax=Myroides sp. N17-2 TaxID=2030799 RepID=UPI001C1F72DB